VRHDCARLRIEALKGIRRLINDYISCAEQYKVEKIDLGM